MLQWSLGYVPTALDVKVLVPDVLDSNAVHIGPADYTEICQCGGGQIVQVDVILIRVCIFSNREEVGTAF